MIKYTNRYYEMKESVINELNSIFLSKLKNPDAAVEQCIQFQDALINNLKNRISMIRLPYQWYISDDSNGYSSLLDQLSEVCNQSKLAQIVYDELKAGRSHFPVEELVAEFNSSAMRSSTCYDAVTCYDHCVEIVGNVINLATEYGRYVEDSIGQLIWRQWENSLTNPLRMVTGKEYTDYNFIVRFVDSIPVAVKKEIGCEYEHFSSCMLVSNEIKHLYNGRTVGFIMMTGYEDLALMSDTDCGFCCGRIKSFFDEDRLWRAYLDYFNNQELLYTMTTGVFKICPFDRFKDLAVHASTFDRIRYNEVVLHKSISGAPIFVAEEPDEMIINYAKMFGVPVIKRSQDCKSVCRVV